MAGVDGVGGGLDGAGGAGAVWMVWIAVMRSFRALTIDAARLATCGFGDFLRCLPSVGPRLDVCRGLMSRFVSVRPHRDSTSPNTDRHSLYDSAPCSWVSRSLYVPICSKTAASLHGAGGGVTVTATDGLPLPSLPMSAAVGSSLTAGASPPSALSLLTHDASAPFSPLTHVSSPSPSSSVTSLSLLLAARAPRLPEPPLLVDRGRTSSSLSCCCCVPGLAVPPLPLPLLVRVPPAAALSLSLSPLTRFFFFLASSFLTPAVWSALALACRGAWGDEGGWGSSCLMGWPLDALWGDLSSLLTLPADLGGALLVLLLVLVVAGVGPPGWVSMAMGAGWMAGAVTDGAVATDGPNTDE
mmetsp:Transcript_50122/g.125668  ORF Transcript_50122/g.125668 Transcript_50122/m.125668 type:complete len:356 (-) Transcript_50122:560-1627(-)